MGSGFHRLQFTDNSTTFNVVGDVNTFRQESEQGERRHEMGDVSVKKNADGLQWKNIKTRQGYAHNEVKEVMRVYEDREETAYCPVSMYQLYASKRPKDMCEPESRFYLQTNSFSSKEAMAKEEVWYKKQVYLPQ